MDARWVLLDPERIERERETEVRKEGEGKRARHIITGRPFLIPVISKSAHPATRPNAPRHSNEMERTCNALEPPLTREYN